MTKSQLLLYIATCCVAVEVFAYPLDGQDETGIRRLAGYQIAQVTKGQPKLSRGQLLGSSDISLKLTTYDGPDFDQMPEDPALSEFLNEVLKDRNPSYAMVLIDMSDLAAIRWAGLRADVRQNAGSVGKLVTMAGLFYALKDAFPDVNDRARILRETTTAAGSWVGIEQHKVPKWNEELQINESSVIVPGDEFRLSEWLDHAVSASANGAGAIVWRETMLIRHFGSSYPRSAAENEQFFRETPKLVLGELARKVAFEPLQAAGIDTANLQQGSFWTAPGKNKVPGIISFATPRELARLLFRIEQGKLVDEWSSLQMKKYLYMTKRRYRYAYAPELKDAAVFFKSGSLYSCEKEEGFRCGKYMGNVRNMMNSTAIVETLISGATSPTTSPTASPQAPNQVVGQPPTQERPLHYIATLMSNVLRINSAWDHSSIGAAVHETMRTKRLQALKEDAPARLVEDAGKSD